MSLPVVCDMHSCIGGRAECPFASVVPTLRPFQALSMHSKIDPPGLNFLLVCWSCFGTCWWLPLLRAQSLRVGCGGGVHGRPRLTSLSSEPAPPLMSQH